MQGAAPCQNALLPETRGDRKLGPERARRGRIQVSYTDINLEWIRKYTNLDRHNFNFFNFSHQATPNFSIFWNSNVQNIILCPLVELKKQLINSWYYKIVELHLVVNRGKFFVC